MSDKLLKAKQDYSKETTDLLEEVRLTPKKDLQTAIDKLYALEKKTRQDIDSASSTRILIGIVTLCKQADDWERLNANVQLLSKKHGQLKQSLTKLIQTVIGFLDDTPDLKTKLSVIDMLRKVTEGKIFVEVERAKVTRILSDIRVASGDVNGAAEILCELQVQTFGTMPRRDQTDFILEQVSLSIQKGDWNQAAAIGHKINPKYFLRKSTEQLEKEQKEREEYEKNRSVDDPPMEPYDDVSDLKIRFYKQQIQIAKHESRYLDACKYYRELANTEIVEKNADELYNYLRSAIHFIILSPHGDEQSQLLDTICDDARNEKLPEEKELLELFTKPEVMRWPEVQSQHGAHLNGTDVFSINFDAKDPKASERWIDLRRRVIEHNLRIVAKYYTRISTKRLQTLLDLGEDEAEKFISDLVTAGTIYARIDRLSGIINFAKTRDVDDLLNEWATDVRSLLGLLNRVGHLITKEEMMVRIKNDKERGLNL